MPQIQGKQKVNSKPSPSLLRKLLGGPISESTEQEWPELAKEWASAQINMPNETAMTDFVGPMGPVERFITGGASGRNNLGRISINRNVVTQDKNLKDVLQHELTHMGQKSRGLMGYLKSIGTSWDKRPEEIEATQAESRFPRRKSDIYLPSDDNKKKKK